MLLSIAKVAAVLGVCTKTLYRWKSRRIIISHRTTGNHRRYDSGASYAFLDTGDYKIEPKTKTGVTAVYFRVSSGKQKDDLLRQGAYLHRISSDRIKSGELFKVKI